MANALGVSPDGSRVFVTGSSVGSTSSTDYATVAYDASTGAKVWAKRYNGSGNGDDGAGSLGVSPDGSKVFVTGTSLGATSSTDYATVAYDASTGAEVWAKRYNGSGNGYEDVHALGVSPNGSKVFVTGVSERSTNRFDYATVAYDASTGAKVWVKRYNGPANGDDEAYALRVSPDGSKVFVTGGCLGPTLSYDYATVAYDASMGAQVWVKRYDGPEAQSDDGARALGVSPDGTKVVVTGTSSFDYATVAYDASTGTKLWTKRYTGRGYDLARALGVSPDGSEVFVTGYIDSSGDSEYATVAYGIT